MMNWQTPFVDFWKGRAKIQQLGELTAVQHMAAIARDNQRNIEAESAAVRRKLWGDESKAETEDMGTTILGDVTHPAPIVINQPAQSSSMLPMIAGMLISGLLGGGIAGAAAYAIAKRPTTQPTYQDETVSIGLGRIDDYTGATEK